MNTKQYKYIIAFVLAFMALPMMAQDYMNIFFKNGDFRKFYMKNIMGIVATKFDAEGVEHEDYSYQQITTIYDKYIYKLEDVDSITFTKIDEEKAEQNFVTAMPQVFSAIEDCETIADVEKKIDQIKNTEGVADAWSDGHELHVSIDEGETFSFHFNHDNSGLEEIVSNDFVARIRAMKTQFVNMLKDDGTPLKVLITDQQSKDKSRDNSRNFNILIQEFAKCGIIVDYPKDPSVEFFYNNSEDPDNLNFYDYDIVLFSTHGCYGAISYNSPEKEKRNGEVIPKEAYGMNGHSILTSEDIGDPIDSKNKNTWAKNYKTFEEWRNKKQFGDVTDVHISYTFIEEERGGQKKWVAHPMLTEYFFRDIAPGHFNNPNSIFHNVACQSLMGDSPDQPSYSFANVLFNKGLGVYLGYTETNMSGQRGGCELLFNMALGNSIKASYDKLPDWCKLESLENIENNADVFIVSDDPQLDNAQKVINYYRENPPHDAELKILYSDNIKVSDSFFLFPIFTVSKDNAQANEEYSGKGQVTISGLTTFSRIENGVSAGFYYSTNQFRLNQKIEAEKEIISDNENGNCLFKAQLINLEPEKTYYYRAYTFDGVNYNWGETKSFTTPKSAETEIITFEDQKVKELCIKKWDTNGDGELSKEEAAAVRDLGTVFYNKGIISFNELQYFTGLTSLGNAFHGCRSLTSIVIPNSVTTIGYSAFWACYSLASISIPNSVTSIGGAAFYYCNGLTSVAIGSSVTSIGELAFYGCSDLTSVTIPTSVTSIGNNAFQCCSGLTSITIPNSVTSIGSGAFRECSSLTSVTIGSGVNSLGSNAFGGCSELAEVYCLAENIQSVDNNAFAYSPIESATLHVPAASLDDYMNTKPWKNFGTIVGF